MFIYVKPETIREVYMRLLLNNSETILAFTYKRLPDNKYENYYMNNDFELEKRIESYAVTFNAMPVIENTNHGVKSNIENGFAISGIDFPFRCPSGWEFKNGKCELPDICNLPEDAQYYRGINYYQFNEAIMTRISPANYAFHSRLYFNCDTNEIEECKINELYEGGDRIEQINRPCKPYDICSDRMTRTIHTYPIFYGDVLADNEYYICENGSSSLRVCPTNTAFSQTQMACLPINLCLNEQNGKTFNRDSDSSFIICNNGQERIIQCPSSIINPTGEYECRNTLCDAMRVTFLVLNTFFRIPVSFLYCEPNTNVLDTFACDLQLITVNDDISHLINENLPLPYTNDRFESYEKPTYVLDVTQKSCVPFDPTDSRYVLQQFVSGSFCSELLPELSINILTKNVDFSADRTPGIYFKDNLSIYLVNDELVNEFVTESTGYANFTQTLNLDAWKYQTDFRMAIGDHDGIVYSGAIQFPYYFANNRSATSLNAGYINSVLVTDDINFFNAYTQTFTTVEKAHSLSALGALLDTDAEIANGLYGDIARMFQFKIVGQQADNYIIAVWSTFGAILVMATLKEHVTIDAGIVAHKYLPDQLSITEILEEQEISPGPLYGFVTNVIDKSFNYDHSPELYKYFDIVMILEPIEAMLKTKEEHFYIPQALIYVYSL
jgi:predicted DNA-binding protein YlxM (UPF0122 family)